MRVPNMGPASTAEARRSGYIHAGLKRTHWDMGPWRLPRRLY
jgi:hypothetical protein